MCHRHRTRRASPFDPLRSSVNVRFAATQSFVRVLNQNGPNGDGLPIIAGSLDRRNRTSAIVDGVRYTFIIRHCNQAKSAPSLVQMGRPFPFTARV